MYEVTDGHVIGTNGIPVSYSYLQPESSSDTLVILLPVKQQNPGLSPL